FTNPTAAPGESQNRSSVTTTADHRILSFNNQPVISPLTAQPNSANDIQSLLNEQRTLFSNRFNTNHAQFSFRGRYSPPPNLRTPRNPTHQHLQNILISRRTQINSTIETSSHNELRTSTPNIS